MPIRARHGGNFCRLRDCAKIIAMDQTTFEAVDLRMMARCIALSRQAVAAGEFPFAALICRNGEIVAEATNRVARERDVTRHAELLALSQAQRALGAMRLSGCSLYSNIEPCAMCAFPVREARIARVVFAIPSPLMGGHSRWNVLGDHAVSNIMPEAFGQAPQVVAGILQEEAERVWREWNPLIWRIIKHRGCFGEVPDEAMRAQWIAAAPKRSFLRRLLPLYH